MKVVVGRVHLRLCETVLIKPLKYSPETNKYEHASDNIFDDTL